MNSILKSFEFGMLMGIVIGFVFGGLILEYRTKISVAESSGFTIGNGVLEQEWRCQPITEHKTLEDAKAQVERYQAMVRG